MPALVAGAALAVVASGIAFASSAPAADVCSQAQDLIDRGYPADAITLITQARDLGFTAAASVPSSDGVLPSPSGGAALPTAPPTAGAATATPAATELCAEQYEAAVILSTSPDAIIEAKCIAAGRLNEDGEHEAAVNLIEQARADAAKRLTGGEVLPSASGDVVAETVDPAADPGLICETEFEDAQNGLRASAGGLVAAWSDFRTGTIDPMVPTAALIGSLILALFVLTRLLVTLPFLSDPRTRRSDRVTWGWVGAAGVVVAPIAAVVQSGGICAWGATSCDGAGSWIALYTTATWAVIAIAAAFPLAYAFGSRLRLAVQGRGSVAETTAKGADAGKDASKAATTAGTAPASADASKKTDDATKKTDDATKKTTDPTAPSGTGGSKPIPFLAHLREMGGGPTRGVEVPTGTDVTSIAPLVAEMPNSTVLKWIVRVWDVVVNATPWKVSIDDTDSNGDEIVVTISRNGRAVAQEILGVPAAEALLGRGSFPPAKRPEVLASLAAAYVLWTLRERYESELAPGLYGATRWEGIAYHYIATMLLGWEERAQAVKVLEAAVETDRDNRMAATALWLFRFRDSTNVDDLKAYRYWLLRQVDEYVGRKDQQPELSIRQWMTFEALTRNLRALEADDDLAAIGPSIDAARKQIRDLLLSPAPRVESAALHETWRQRWAINVVRADEWQQYRRLGQHTRLSDEERTWWAGALRTSSPVVAFSLACHRAMEFKERRGTPKKVPVAEWRPVERLLLIARVEPAIASWEPYDPELAGFAVGQRAVARSRFDVLVTDPKARPIRKSAAAAALASRCTADDLDGFGLTALKILAETVPTRADVAWLRVNRRSPAGDREVQRVFRTLTTAYGYPGKQRDVQEWLDRISTEPTSTPVKTAPAASDEAKLQRRFLLVWRRTR